MAGFGTIEYGKPIDFDGIKARCDLRDIIVPVLQKASPVRGGEYWVACCPFHDDKRPSFIVRKDSYCCMASGCGEWGSVWDWYSRLYPGYDWRELADLIEREAATSHYLPARVVIAKDETEPLPELMDVSNLAEYQHYDDRFAEWLNDFCYDKWLLSKETVARECIGYDVRQKAIAIPVWGNSYNELITVRFRNVDNERMGKYWGILGRNGVYGYGRMWVKDAEYAIVVFGEMTALFLHQWGFASFSWTNGCMSFRPYLKKLLSHLKGGVVIPDVGEEEQARCVARQLGDGWKVAFLDLIWDGDGDVIDWVKSGKGNYTKFCDLITNRATDPDDVRKYWSEKYPINWRR